MFRDLFARLTGRAADGRGGVARERFVLRGVPVVVENSRPDIATADVLERLDAALALIEAHQPWRLAHFRRDVRQVLVTRYACRGAYFPDQRTVMTELTFLARRDITAAPVASSILHEGVHARVHRMGERLGSYWEQRDTAREERLCRRAELAFGQSLPESLGAPVVARALETLSMADRDVAPAIDWREAQARIDAVDGSTGGSGRTGA